MPGDETLDGDKDDSYAEEEGEALARPGLDGRFPVDIELDALRVQVTEQCVLYYTSLVSLL